LPDPLQTVQLPEPPHLEQPESKPCLPSPPHFEHLPLPPQPLHSAILFFSYTYFDQIR
jgi:hypothetical protein